MSPASKRVLMAGAAGALFGAGLVLSGMTQPRKVIAFLDVFGHWDASLLLVMAGAICVHAPLYRLVTRRARPLFAARFEVPTRRDVGARLLLGAALFGIGWGVAGYCPGPSFVALPSSRAGVVVFVLALVCGTLLTIGLERWFAATNGCARQAIERS
jgi:uncharacterized membrane protein YedE/YeeE